MRKIIDVIFLIVAVFLTGIAIIISLPILIICGLLSIFRIKHIMYLYLFVISFLSSILLYPIGLLYDLTKFNIKDYREMAIGLDVTGNIVLKNILNTWLRKKSGFDFGDRRYTISETLCINFNRGSLTTGGKILASILNFIKPKHIS